MYDKDGNKKNAIVIDGVKYVLSPEEEIKKYKNECDKKVEDAENKVKALEVQMASYKEISRIANGTKQYFLKCLSAFINDKDNKKLNDLEIGVDLNFVDRPFRGDPGYSNQTSKTFKNFGEAIAFIDEEVYKRMDKPDTHTYDYCDVMLKVGYNEVYKGKFVNIDYNEMALYLHIESDCEYKSTGKRRDWAEIIFKAYDNTKNPF